MIICVDCRHEKKRGYITLYYGYILTIVNFQIIPRELCLYNIASNWCIVREQAENFLASVGVIRGTKQDRCSRNRRRCVVSPSITAKMVATTVLMEDADGMQASM